MGEPAKMGAMKNSKKGENPPTHFETMLISLLTTLLTKVVHKVLTELFTDGNLSKWFSGKGPQ